jgi:hypothetical protein
MGEADSNAVSQTGLSLIDAISNKGGRRKRRGQPIEKYIETSTPNTLPVPQPIDQPCKPIPNPMFRIKPELDKTVALLILDHQKSPVRQLLDRGRLVESGQGLEGWRLGVRHADIIRPCRH